MMRKETEDSFRIMAGIIVNNIEHSGERGREANIDYVVTYLKTAWGEGNRTGIKSLIDVPWQIAIVALKTETVNEWMAHGWEPWEVCGPDSSRLILRRRKAVSDGETKQSS